MAVSPQVIYTVVDNKGKSSTTTVNVPSALTLAAYQEFAADMAELMDNVIQGVITGADFCLTADLSGLTNNTQGIASDIEDTASFKFGTVDNRVVSINVPTLDETKVNPGSDTLDQADPDVAAFIAAMTDGLSVTLGTIEPTDVGEIDINSLISALEGFKSTGQVGG